MNSNYTASSLLIFFSLYAKAPPLHSLQPLALMLLQVFLISSPSRLLANWLTVSINSSGECGGLLLSSERHTDQNQ